jgi:aconitase A
MAVKRLMKSDDDDAKWGCVRQVYEKIEQGSPSWQSLDVPQGRQYGWDLNSTYIKKPPFFDGMTKVSGHGLRPTTYRQLIVYLTPWLF